MIAATLTITLILEGPIISKSTSIGGFGVDAVMARTGGAFCLPGSLIKGKLRQAWQELEAAAKPLFKTDPDWLGGKSEKRGQGEEKSPGEAETNDSDATSPPNSNEPYRGLLRFSDFLHDRPSGTASICRISIDSERGAVRNRHLQVIEAPFAAGETVCFVGTVSFSARDRMKADHICHYVEVGLRWLTSIGGARTIGLGRLVDVCSRREYEELRIPPEETIVGDQLSLVINPQGPFCVARRRISENLFESEEVIPGGVIKGAIASMWGSFLGKGPNEPVDKDFDPDRPELCNNFSRLRFQHAFPARAGQTTRPVISPLSLVKVKGEDDVYDVAEFAGPILIDGKAPEFDIDWKKRGNVDRMFGWPDLERELRMHTEIDPTHRKVNKEMLFAYETILPGDNQWCSVVDLGKTEEKDRPAVKRQLLGLLSAGLNGWGKTKVNALVTLESAPRPFHVSTQENDKYYIITLQTPALLCDPEEHKLCETSGESDLAEAYLQVWSQLSGGCLELEKDRYFARQSLAGGGYLHNRFSRGKKYYRPYLLTDAGSVFVLRATAPEKSAQTIATWLRDGVPLPQWAMERYKASESHELWRVCPYLPENGYGEIVVNLKTHWTLKPEKYEEVRDVI